jgi:hypothetical protein
MVFGDGLGRTNQFLHEQQPEVMILTQVPEVGWQVSSVLAGIKIGARATGKALSNQVAKEWGHFNINNTEDGSGHYRRPAVARHKRGT